MKERGSVYTSGTGGARWHFRIYERYPCSYKNHSCIFGALSTLSTGLSTVFTV